MCSGRQRLVLSPGIWVFDGGPNMPKIKTAFRFSQELNMDEISSEVLLQLSADELGEVLEEFLGIELSDTQVAGMRQLLQTAGSLEGAIAMLETLSSSAEAA
jgi:hypothetical protein